ncbi:MAG: hypothetical protein KDA72_06775 [Planctomycetales bacterium]|nr:hypothetical protein [Planctomycetales bacterium]
MKSGKSTFSTTLIVLATIGLVAAPVIADQFRTEVARWYLAEASNRLVAERDSSHQLEQAGRWAEDVTDLRDYWIFRVEQALADSPKKVAAVIAEAVAKRKSNAFLANTYSMQLASRGLFAEAVDVLEAGKIPELDDNLEWLNNLAYFRALAGVDLDQALSDIDRVLAKTPHAADARDTRAWVLFQMGNPQLALEDADFAVKSLTVTGDASWLDSSLTWLEDNVLTPREPQTPTKLFTRREAGERLWRIATLHYHRAKILEALGRDEEADKEFQWLKEHNLPIDGSIY